MNRQYYYNYIDEKFETLASRIRKNGKLNILALHLHSEFFYQYFLNKLYGWKLKNENSNQQNVEAIDLIDDDNKFILQVSATSSKQKIEKSLEKDKINKYPGYTFKFVSIARDSSDLREKTFKNPHKINFDPKTDIIDKTSLFAHIASLEIGILEDLYEFIQDELGGEVDIVKLDSNLAEVINILAKEDWDSVDEPTVNAFEIDRKIQFNNLNDSKYIIDDYKAYSPRVDKKFSEFDLQGVNKSNSVLSKIKGFYVRNKGAKSDDELFFSVIDDVMQYVKNSSNFDSIPDDELELCVNILVVDAFIRCKIFENPNKDN